CQRPEDQPDRFFQPFNPPLRLHVVGAVHIAQPLSQMAAQLGYAVTLIDPRASFAREERFSGLHIVTEWPDDALAELGIDPRTAVVTLTHDPKLDDPALSAALKSEAFYVGALGSRRTHAARRRRLAEEGFDDSALDRIHGPVGLSIGARSPGEIAVSIMAQITEVLRTST
ncbi:MAG: XdhC family protein, partial [Planctomycetota bacterium]